MIIYLKVYQFIVFINRQYFNFYNSLFVFKCQNTPKIIKYTLPKMDLQDQSQISKSYYKRLYCGDHGNKYIFKCEYSNCQNPLICSQGSCLDSHFHPQNDGRLVIVKINSSQSFKKFGEIERIFTKQDFASEARQLKSFIDQLKLSMVAIYKDYKQLYVRKDYFLSDGNKPYQKGFQQKVDQTITLGMNIRKNIDTLKAKVNIPNHVPIQLEQSNSHKSINGGQSPLYCRSQTNSEQKSFYQSTDKRLNYKRTQNKEQGEVSFQSSPKNLNNQVPVPLQVSKQSISNSFSFMQKSFSPKNNTQNGIHKSPQLSTNQKQSKFDQLFQTNSSKPQLNDERNYSFDKANVGSNNSNKLVNSKNGSSTNGINNINGNNSVYGANQKNKNLDISYQIIIDDASQEKDIDLAFKSKPSSQQLKIYERNFFMKPELTVFLERTIHNFSWGLCEQIYSSNMPLKPIDKFHELLQSRRNLLFLFIGEGRIIGSFYPSRYPRLVQKLRNDPNSFMFISNNEKTKIVQFRPISNDFHLSVSDKLHICQGNTPSYGDGIRTYQKNFHGINYCLPSELYKYKPSVQEQKQRLLKGQEAASNVYSGVLSVKQFFVLQFNDNAGSL